MKKYNIWYEEPKKLDEELLEVCRTVAAGNESYLLFLEDSSLEIPMSNVIYKLMKKEHEETYMKESEVLISSDIKNIRINDFVADVINSIRTGVWSDSYLEKYCNPDYLIACNLEEIIGKATSTEALTDIVGWRIKYGKKTVLVGTEKDKWYSTDLLAVLRQLKTVHIGYAECDEGVPE